MEPVGFGQVSEGQLCGLRLLLRGLFFLRAYRFDRTVGSLRLVGSVGSVRSIRGIGRFYFSDHIIAACGHRKANVTFF